MSTIRLVAVGTSWGGLEALGRLLSGLQPGFGAALVVVQHRSAATPEGAMRAYLAERSPLAVVDCDDKEPIQPGRVHLAPPDYHLLVDDGLVTLSLDAPVAYSRPSVDVLFESAADSYGSEMVAVVLTGANTDGSRGVVKVHQAGGRVLVQDPAEAERPEMPAAAIATGAAHEVLDLRHLAIRLNELDRSL
ncbi:MAG TPA: chemotaxis protein CheB [Acidimicrobiales bacterium]|nr:chemotaxis protein CheB [Acidimicrobiales bacterium]